MTDDKLYPGPPERTERAPLHGSTLDYLQPTGAQIAVMSQARGAARAYMDALEALLPSGPDKTYTLRKLREVAMWANVAITRQADGAPRQGP
jgi:hypothetical protein